jgi:hypothetical protein
MSTFYELIGRAVVGLLVRSYGSRVKVAAAAGLGVVAAAALAAYVATRDDGEET